MPDITTTFELPIGLEENGKRHTTVTMRRLKGKDVIELASDQRIQALARENLDIELTDFDISSLDGSDSLSALQKFSGKFNPVRMQMIEGITWRINCITFSRVILSIGEIERPSPDKIMSLDMADLKVILRQHIALNKSNPSGDTEAVGPRAPFGSPS